MKNKNIKIRIIPLKNFRKISLSVLLLLSITLLIYGLLLVKDGRPWDEFSGFNNKTIWDLSELLIIPLTVAVIVYILDLSDRKKEREISRIIQSENALLKYYEIFSKYVIDYDMLNSENGEILKDSLNNITNSIFLSLDNHRAKILFNFLLDNEFLTDSKYGDKPTLTLNNVCIDNLNMFIKYLGCICLTNCKIRNSDFNLSNIVNAKFQNCDFSSSIFISATLNNSKIYDSDFSYANFSNADLLNTTFSNVNFFKTNLQHANFENADLSGAKNFKKAVNKKLTYNENTKWPENLKPEDLGVEYYEQEKFEG